MWIDNNNSKSNQVLTSDFLDLIENKSDEEIKKIFESCNKEELINNIVIFLKIIKENKKTNNTFYKLIEDVKKGTEEISDIIRLYK